MIKIPIKSGGHAFIFHEGEPFLGGEVNFLDHEWSWTKRLALSFKDDPEALSSFWETILKKKRDSTTYSVYDDFPKEQNKPLPTGSLVDYVGRIIEKLKEEGTLK